MFRRISGVVLAAALVGGLVAVGATPASAADPLTIAKPNPSGATEYDKIVLPSATRASFYAFQLIANGGQPPYTWAHDDAHSSPWDFGLSISPSGLISGTPPVGEETGSYGSVQDFIVTDSAVPPNTATISTRMWVDPYFRITNTSLPNGVAGQPYSVQLKAKGGHTPFKFSRGASLPKGLKLVSRTGLLYGVPKWGGQYSVSINVEDSEKRGFANKTFLLSVAGPTGPGGGGGKPKPIISGTGDLACSGGAVIKAVGAGSNGSGYISAQFKGRLSCQGSTGNPLVRVTGATVQGHINYSGACSIIGVHSGFPVIDIVWKTAGGKMNSTTVQYSNHDARTDGWQLPATNPAGTSQVTGSYAGDGTSNAFLATSAPSQLQSMCGSSPSKATIGAVFLIRL